MQVLFREPHSDDFLGYHFERAMRWLRRKSLDNLEETLRAKTKRTDGRSLRVIIADVNRTLRGWFGYFCHSGRTTFPAIDGCVRMRLRSILRKRSGRRGRGHGADHQRWPNAYFPQHGYFSLTATQKQACQFSLR